MTLDLFNVFTVTVTPQSVWWKYTSYDKYWYVMAENHVILNGKIQESILDKGKTPCDISFNHGHICIGFEADDHESVQQHAHSI